MTFDDYKQAVKADAIEAIQRGDYDYCEDFEQVDDNLWIDDSVTGNGSGSYTFSTAKAKENVSDLIWDEEFIEECADLDVKIGELLEKGPEALDVTARCLALGYVRDDLESAWNARKGESTDPANWEFDVMPNKTGYILVADEYDGSTYQHRLWEMCADLSEVFGKYAEVMSE